MGFGAGTRDGCLVDHGLGPFERRADEFGDGGRLGKVAPVFFGHLRAHGAELESGGVEDGAVVGAPIALEAVVVGDVGARGAGAELGVLAGPVHAPVGGQDGEPHSGEAADEEGGVGFDDVVVGLEPGDVADAAGITAGAGDFAEAYEGAHLVGVAADGLGEAQRPVHRWVGDRSGEVALALVVAPDQAVEQGEPLGVVGLDDGLGEVDEGA